MKITKFLACLLFSFAVLKGNSQKVYFIYLQSESGQPFFVKLNGRNHSSSATGYLILSRLHDSTYNFYVGFPQNKWPEQNFTVSINKKDHGYLLKNFGEKGWGLFDLQTLSIQMSLSGSAKAEEKKPVEQKDISVFTGTLAKAANDPSLLEKPVQPVAEEKKPETAVVEKIPVITSPEPAKDSIALTPPVAIEQIELKKEGTLQVSKEVPVPVVENLLPKVIEAYKPTVVAKRSESSTTEGFGLVFIDQSENGTDDTIRLLIPNPKTLTGVITDEPKEEKRFIEILPDTLKKKEEAPVEIVKVAVADSSGIIADEPKEEKQVIDILADTLKKKEDAPVDIIKVAVADSSGKILPKNNCTETAANSDFFILRKNMAAAEGDENMLMEARSYFKLKCFTTEQVRNLGLLFLNDEGKYKFFDLAYTYVTDPVKFRVLQEELKDEYYINRFKALLRY